MIKEALQYFASLANTRFENIGNQVISTQPVHVVSEPTCSTLVVNSLSGLVEYLKSNFDSYLQLLVHVESPTEVSVVTSYNRDKKRNEVITARALLPQFTFDRFYDAESFNIKLQSCFVPNEDRAIMLQVVGNIKEENVSTIGDDGVSQAVVAKTGVATVATVKVPNPVKLRPYRTFVEVEQPESEFIFRMKNGPDCALFEADGGAWKLEAMKRVKSYLEERLAEEIASGNIVIIA